MKCQDKTQVNHYLKTLQTPSLPLSASWGDCQNNTAPFWELISQILTKFPFNDLSQPLSSSSLPLRIEGQMQFTAAAVGILPIKRSITWIFPRLSVATRPAAQEMADAMVRPLEPLPRAVQIQNSHLHFRTFWFATIWIYLYWRLFGNSSLSIHVLPPPPSFSLFIKFVGTKICYLFIFWICSTFGTEYERSTNSE